LVVSSEPLPGTGEPTPPTPSLMLLQNVDDGFVPARRLWNQHAYTPWVSSELGKIPVGTVAGSSLDAFRTNARLDENPACIPPLPSGSN
jgi:hypothetical protein